MPITIVRCDIDCDISGRPVTVNKPRPRTSQKIKEGKTDTILGSDDCPVCVLAIRLAKIAAYRSQKIPPSPVVRANRACASERASEQMNERIRRINICFLCILASGIWTSVAISLLSSSSCRRYLCRIS